MSQDKDLKRTLKLFSLTLYGIGSIIGAGIYVIIGKVASYAGNYTPLAFVLSAVIAFFSAISFAELSSRYPKSAGEAVYVKAAFNKELLTSLIGWLVVITGIVSTAALANGFVGYLHLFVNIPRSTVISLFVVILGTIAIWGIKESVVVIVAITAIEIAGLLLVIALSGSHFHHINYLNLVPKHWGQWQGIFLGSFISFYAFIGLEDIVNVAEETINPKKTVPYSILLSVLISSILYFLVAIAAILILPLSELINSKAPMASIVQKAGYSPVIIGIVGLITVINGALVNIIMASRVIYGMAELKSLPKFFAKVHSKTQTPVNATLLVNVMILVLGLFFPITILAQTTSFVMLVVYFFVNLALIFVKLKSPKPRKPVITFPIIFPMIGIITTLLLLFVRTIMWAKF